MNIKYLFILLFFVINISFSQKQHHFDEINSRIRLFQKINSGNYSPTQNQLKYDVSFYSLNLNIDPSIRYITGCVDIICSVIEDITLIELNLTNGFVIDSVSVNNSKSTFTYSNDILSINLGKLYQKGNVIKLSIAYQGYPSSSGFGSFGVSNIINKKLIWTLSEPFGSRDWWPCKDHPYDKADSVDVIITVPKEMIVASNGLLRNVKESNNLKTYYWHESYPISTYLISVTAYPYYTFSNYYRYTEKDSMEIKYYTVQEPSKYPTFSLVPNMIKVFSELFGEYPFIKEKYGHVEFPWGGGMEHQTCTSLGSFSEFIIVHELAHQWWGDMITCKDFHHIWLNEGFATYSEALYAEKVYGTKKYFEEMQFTKYLGRGTIYVDDLSNISRIFSSDLTYNKASWVLHMLRHVVGDDTFFKILKHYYNSKYQYGSIDTEEFQNICETVYKKDLGWFFHQWIYEEYYPQYQFSYTTQRNGNQSIINLNINQTQKNYIFKMPIDVNISTTNGDTIVIVFDSLKNQNFNLIVNGIVNKITLDKNEWILRSVEEVLSNVNSGNFPHNYSLFQNYPNPFNPSTNISISLPQKEFVTLKVYDLLGREITTLFEGEKEAGIHTFEFTSSNKNYNITSGIYLYQLKTKNYSDTKKMLLIK